MQTFSSHVKYITVQKERERGDRQKTGTDLVILVINSQLAHTHREKTFRSNRLWEFLGADILGDTLKTRLKPMRSPPKNLLAAQKDQSSLKENFLMASHLYGWSLFIDNDCLFHNLLVNLAVSYICLLSTFRIKCPTLMGIDH